VSGEDKPLFVASAHRFYSDSKSYLLVLIYNRCSASCFKMTRWYVWNKVTHNWWKTQKT